MTGRARLALTIVLALLAGCAQTGHRHTRSVTDPDARLHDNAPAIGSAIIESPPFDEALLSWDVRLGEGASAVLDAQVRRGGVWSAWLRIARRGPAVCEPPRREDPLARIDVDMIVCREPADAIRWRVLSCGGPAEVRTVWVTTTGVGLGEPLRDAAEPPAVAHPVPHKAQREGGEELGGRLCSPTAVAMVVESRGVPAEVGEMAARVHDADFDLYGNWVNNTLAACEMGVPMCLTRIRDWTETEAFLREGPVIVSLPPFSRRQLEGAGYSSASGHLIVLTGFDGAGGVLVRDPAHADPAEAARVYRRDQLTRLWLVENKGTAYVLAPR